MNWHLAASMDKNFWFLQCNLSLSLGFLSGKSCHVSDGVCVQSIEHPGCVWDAKFLENGDIVTACSDGVIRIWTSHQNKIADSLELESYASQISQYKRSRYDHPSASSSRCMGFFAILK